jgi:TetR/AcrR family transcriptional regulator, repressor of fatR-cypB operon
VSQPRPTPFFIQSGDPPSKQAILVAALKLFVRDGLNGTSVRAIGTEAGYSNPALFKFFSSRDELAIYLFERCYARTYDVLDAAVSPRRSFEQNLSTFLRALLALLDENMDAFLFVQDNLRTLWPRCSPALRKKSIVALTRRLLAQGQNEGAVRADVPRELVAAALMGFLLQFGRLFYFGEFEGNALSWLAHVERLAQSTLRA